MSELPTPRLPLAEGRRVQELIELYGQMSVPRQQLVLQIVRDLSV